MKNLSEVFWFIHQFAVLGREEVCSTLLIVVIIVVINKQFSITFLRNGAFGSVFHFLNSVNG